MKSPDEILSRSEALRECAMSHPFPPSTPEWFAAEVLRWAATDDETPAEAVEAFRKRLLVSLKGLRDTYLSEGDYKGAEAAQAAMTIVEV
jgi:hypothetical protein